MLVKIEARILIFPRTDFHFSSSSVNPGTFLGSASISERTRPRLTRWSGAALAAGLGSETRPRVNLLKLSTAGLRTFKPCSHY